MVKILIPKNCEPWIDLGVFKFFWVNVSTDYNSSPFPDEMRDYVHLAIFDSQVCNGHSITMCGYSISRMRIISMEEFKNLTYHRSYKMCDECLASVKEFLLFLDKVKLGDIINKISIDTDFFKNIDTGSLIPKEKIKVISNDKKDFIQKIGLLEID